MTKKVKKYTILPLMVISVILAYGCSSEEDTYQKGTEAGAEVVYFDSSNSSNIVMEESEFATSPKFNLTLSRKGDASKALSVPVEVKLNEGNFKVPATAEFTAGKTTTSIDIDLTGAEKYEILNYKLKIADAYCNPYAKGLDGMDVFRGSVLISSWKTIVKGARQYFGSDSNVYTTNDIQKLTGTNRFKIVNIYNTGIDMAFSINASNYDDNDMSTWKGDFTPLNNISYDSYGYWWLSDEDGNDILIDYNGMTKCDVGCYAATAGYNPVSFVKSKSSGRYSISLYTYLYFSGYNYYNTYIVWDDSDFANK